MLSSVMKKTGQTPRTRQPSGPMGASAHSPGLNAMRSTLGNRSDIIPTLTGLRPSPRGASFNAKEKMTIRTHLSDLLHVFDLETTPRQPRFGHAARGFERGAKKKVTKQNQFVEGVRWTTAPGARHYSSPASVSSASSVHRFNVFERNMNSADRSRLKVSLQRAGARIPPCEFW